MQKHIISETKHFLFCLIIFIATTVMPSVVIFFQKTSHIWMETVRNMATNEEARLDKP